MIRLQFALQDDLPSELITYFSHGAGFSHVDAIMPDGRLLGARADGGVQIRSPGYAKFSRVLQVSLPSTPDQERVFWDFLNQQVGKPYDWKAILGFAAGRDWRRSDAWICSEADGSALETAVWFPYPLATPSYKLTPDDLLLAISARAKVDLAA